MTADNINVNEQYLELQEIAKVFKQHQAKITQDLFNEKLINLFHIVPELESIQKNIRHL